MQIVQLRVSLFGMIVLNNSLSRLDTGDLESFVIIQKIYYNTIISDYRLMTRDPLDKHNYVFSR